MQQAERDQRSRLILRVGAFGIAVAMLVSVPGMDKAQAEALVKAAHEVCPYSNATRGNIVVDVRLA